MKAKTRMWLMGFGRAENDGAKQAQQPRKRQTECSKSPRLSRESTVF
jgi:hypothetical protein